MSAIKTDVLLTEARFIELWKKMFPEMFKHEFTTMWENMCIPYLEATFVTKEELKETMEEQTIHVDRRFMELEQRLDARFDGVQKRLQMVEMATSRLRDRFAEAQKDTETRFRGHTHAMHRLQGLADKGKNYEVEK